jgi:hypothetical protein
MSVRRIGWVLAAALLCATPASAQSDSSPEHALVVLALAPDLKTAMPHLPLDVVHFLEELPPQDAQAAAQEFLPINQFKRAGIVLRAGENGVDLLIAEGGHHQGSMSLRVTRKMIDGLDAMVQVQSCSGDRCDGRLQLWLRLEEQEWRLFEIEQGQGYSQKLDNPEWLEQLHHSEQRDNEGSAIGSLRLLVTALVNYSSTFPDIGFARKISDLAGTGDIDSQHAGLIDPRFENTPLVVRGYKFEYTLLSSGADGSFSITATPTEFGKTGFKSFFVDESGVIRFTKQDRPASAEDDPIQ